MATEAFTRRNTFHVNINWEPGASPSTAKHVQDQMYVESLEPLNKTEEPPLILIHGDYHSSQVSSEIAHLFESQNTSLT